MVSTLDDLSNDSPNIGARCVLHAFGEGNTRSQRAFFQDLCLGAGYVLDGAYLEANFGAFNTALESAMITGHSEGFAEFLADAAHRK